MAGGSQIGAGIAAGLLAWCFVGCAHGPGPIEQAPLRWSARAARRARHSQASRAASIVIDPGHGGVFRGARGTAAWMRPTPIWEWPCHLAGLLHDAGASVTLTAKCRPRFRRR